MCEIQSSVESRDQAKSACSDQVATLEMNAEDEMYRVTECSYSGDNRDGDFIVSGTGESVKDGKVDEGKKVE